MAKSFKQLAGTPPAKRTSEKDFLDFLEQDYESEPVISSDLPVATAAAENTPAASRSESGAQAITQKQEPSAIRKPEAKKRVQPKIETRDITVAVPVTKHVTKADEEQIAAANARNSPNEHHVTDITHTTDVTKQAPDVRQTFVLGLDYLEKLKNFVHTKRLQGQYDFTQKEAMHQALDLLFATAHIVERPDQIRQKEEVRRQQIRKGKSK